MNVYDELPNRIFIEGIEVRDGKKYFKFSISDDSYYHKNDYQFEKEIDFIIKNIHPESYKQALKRAAGGKLYRRIDDSYEDLTTGAFVGWLPSEAIYDREKGIYIVSGVDPVRTVEDMDTLVILDNPSFRKYLLCDYIFFIKYGGNSKIQDEKTVLDYGIKVGMSVKDLYEIIGEPVEINGNVLDYFGSDRNSTMELKIEVKDSKILSINYCFYK